MLSHEDRILSELLIARGLVTRDSIERFAAARKPGVSLLEAVAVGGPLHDADASRQQAVDALEVAAALSGKLRADARLDHFRLVREIGRGGMGVVFEAHDEQLDRRVALKLLATNALLSPHQVERFRREARATARLRHPSLVPVYASGEAAGLPYFTMELVDGQNLAQRTTAGPRFTPREAAKITAEIARALAHAHEHSLVHRDIKPENVLLDAASGLARLTDFGLVRDLEGSSLTLEQGVLGTPAFMPPEQARGEAVTAASDIYSAGALLYYLLSGRAPYAGSQPAAVLARLAAGKPPRLAAVAPDAPARLVAISERAMARSPERRHPDAASLAAELEHYLEHPAEPRPRSRAWIAAGLVAVGAALVAWRLTWGPNLPAPATRPRVAWRLGLPAAIRGFDIAPDGNSVALDVLGTPDTLLIHELTSEGLGSKPLAFANGRSPSFSPDGAYLAHLGEGGLTLRNLATGEIRYLGIGMGTLAWAPDSRRLAIASRRSDGAAGLSLPRRLAIVDVTTGATRAIASTEALAISWSPHGDRIAFTARTGGQPKIWTVSAAGGEATRLTDDDASEWSPGWARDGTAIYYGRELRGRIGLHRVHVNEVSGQRLGIPERLDIGPIICQFSLRVLGDGRRLALAFPEPWEQLLRLPLDPDTGGVVGEPQPIQDELQSARDPYVSPDGSLVAYTALAESDLALVLAEGGSRRLLGQDAFADRGPRFSPAGGEIVFDSDRGGNRDIWLVRADGSHLERLTNTVGHATRGAVWSPDGSEVAVTVDGIGAARVAVRGAGRGQPRLLTPMAGPAKFEPWSWSRDGRYLAGTAAGVVVHDLVAGSYRRVSPVGERPVFTPSGSRLYFVAGSEIRLLDLRSGRQVPVWSTGSSRLLPGTSLDPNGRWLYLSIGTSPEELLLVDLTALATATAAIGLHPESG